MESDKTIKQQTLCLVYDHPRILLGMKKRGFGAGRWNGFGGKVEEGEDIESAVLRELQEEAKVSVKKIEKLGIMHFEFYNKTEEILEVHVFKGYDMVGNPAETEEMKPKWFHEKDIPLNEMWPDDQYWIPLFLRDQKFKGRFLFGDNDSILEMEINKVKDF